jgi:hypothetical protein
MKYRIVRASADAIGSAIRPAYVFSRPGTWASFTDSRIPSIPAAASSPFGSRDKDEVIIGEMDCGLIEEVRNTWQCYRDRRP